MSDSEYEPPSGSALPVVDLITTRADIDLCLGSGELLPCPFCGKPPVWDTGLSGDRWEHADNRNCILRDFIIGTDPVEIQRWNTRHANAGIEFPERSGGKLQ